MQCPIQCLSVYLFILQDISVVSKWEEAKKWQRIADRNKEKLLEKTKQADDQQTLIDRLKQRIKRFFYFAV